ncbi:hypothetical protein BJ508DRAFT_312501 [Ascobolus immersus RN42]|uniref:Uncharacterized protein n=1 Tax=Ascobolus immersus RN42 TaxID=1160509 RepID=A0A3N4HPC1_ASCIM|nr:hypothetical protein BJ508DRAFT_312501 [Ascobolus immersus RN42]
MPRMPELFAGVPFSLAEPDKAALRKLDWYPPEEINDLRSTLLDAAEMKSGVPVPNGNGSWNIRCNRCEGFFAPRYRIVEFEGGRYRRCFFRCAYVDELVCSNAQREFSCTTFRKENPLFFPGWEPESEDDTSSEESSVSSGSVHSDTEDAASTKADEDEAMTDTGTDAETETLRATSPVYTPEASVTESVDGSTPTDLKGEVALLQDTLQNISTYLQNAATMKETIKKQQAELDSQMREKDALREENEKLRNALRRVGEIGMGFGSGMSSPLLL